MLWRPDTSWTQASQLCRLFLPGFSRYPRTRSLTIKQNKMSGDKIQTHILSKVPLTCILPWAHAPVHRKPCQHPPVRAPAADRLCLWERQGRVSCNHNPWPAESTQTPEQGNLMSMDKNSEGKIERYLYRHWWCGWLGPWTWYECNLARTVGRCSSLLFCWDIFSRPLRFHIPTVRAASLAKAETVQAISLAHCEDGWTAEEISQQVVGNCNHNMSG